MGQELVSIDFKVYKNGKYQEVKVGIPVLSNSQGVLPRLLDLYTDYTERGYDLVFSGVTHLSWL